MRKWLPLALAALAALGIATPPAHADGLFVVCPSGTSGVATAVTSCPFADQVRGPISARAGGSSVVAYSPVTELTYLTACAAGFVVHFTDGSTRAAIRCVGGNDAVVLSAAV